ARLAPTLLGLAGLAALPMVLAPQQIIAVVAGPGYEAAAGAMRVMGLAVVSSAAVTASGCWRAVWTVPTCVRWSPAWRLRPQRWPCWCRRMAPPGRRGPWSSPMPSR
ncbi:hypothetical protein, partial [Rubrivivax gelatinosus]|uniref:hypothetical protein n=1 Tax=Rubrivivax gelatinosus TaxID=28068 RepID=UPI00192C3783